MPGGDRVRIYKNDFLYNSGIVGFCNILDYAEKEYVITDNYIEFEKEVLDGFETNFFDYLIDKHYENTPYYKVINEKIRIPSLNEKDLKEVIGAITKKIKSNSWTAGYKLVEDELNFNMDSLLKELSAEKDIEKKRELILNILTLIETKELKRSYLIKDINYTVISNFWDGICFLYPKCKEKNSEKAYKGYFIDECVFVENTKAKYRCAECNSGISLSKSFNLNGFGMSEDENFKNSTYWNFKNTAKICGVCNLIMSCIPAGWTSINKKGIFVNSNMNIKSLISVNRNIIRKSETLENIENKIYFKIARYIEETHLENSKYELENIQVIKIDENNKNKYSFRVFNNTILNTIKRNRREILYLTDSYVKINDSFINLFDETMKRIYNGENLNGLLCDLISHKVRGAHISYTNLMNILKIKTSIGGTMYSKEALKIADFGFVLRQAYIQTGAEHKLDGVCYKMINALRTNNQHGFMDIFIQSHSYRKLQIDNSVFSALATDKFKDLGYAFLIGLMGKEVKSEGEKENE